MEEAKIDINAKTGKLKEILAIFEVVETSQVFKEELAMIKESLLVSNEEIRRLNAVNDSLKAKELELLERQVVAQETMAS